MFFSNRLVFQQAVPSEGGSEEPPIADEIFGEARDSLMSFKAELGECPWVGEYKTQDLEAINEIVQPLLPMLNQLLPELHSYNLRYGTSGRYYRRSYEEEGYSISIGYETDSTYRELGMSSSWKITISNLDLDDNK